MRRFDRRIAIGFIAGAALASAVTYFALREPKKIFYEKAKPELAIEKNDTSGNAKRLLERVQEDFNTIFSRYGKVDADVLDEAVQKAHAMLLGKDSLKDYEQKIVIAKFEGGRFGEMIVLEGIRPSAGKFRELLRPQPLKKSHQTCSGWTRGLSGVNFMNVLPLAAFPTDWPRRR